MSDFYLRRLQGRVGDLVYQLTRVQFAQFSRPHTWRPALNVYRCDECIVICADLSGVDQESVQLRVEAQRLVLRGGRPAPEPPGDANKPVQVLAMEIDYGFFEREVLLPADVEPAKARFEQENGLLWICLPLRMQA
jgi:HSP20 family molecular chaperone IbpA